MSEDQYATQESIADEFLASCPVTPRLASTAQSLRDFLAQPENAGSDATQLRRPLVIVTSGGTTVPLERRCVRFIDNFSAGNRGALSSEEFLKAGYAVLLLRRTSSVQPFTHQLNSTSAARHLIKSLQLTSDGQLTVRPECVSDLTECVSQAQQAEATHSLFEVEYETIFEYLQLLQLIAKTLKPYQSRVLFYLAAAVSDFYVPWEDLAEHKIQSGEGDLVLSLRKVPKVLGVLVHTWAPQAMVVSFKLETDEHILIKKACTALTNYGVHAVVANLLHTRKDRVLVVQPQPLYDLLQASTTQHTHTTQPTPQPDTSIAVSSQPYKLNKDGVPELLQGSVSGTEAPAVADVVVTNIVRPSGEPVIETLLVSHVVRLHHAWLGQRESTRT